MVCRMKIRTKGTDAQDAVRALVKKHGGKIASSQRSSKAWVVGVFPDEDAAKAFFDGSQDAVGGVGLAGWTTR